MAIAIQQVALAVSHLSDLGNLASATIAVNIGYLGLQRFRYREQMRKCATEEILPLGTRGIQESVQNSSQYKDLLYLAHLTDNDGLDDIKKLVPLKGYSPSGGWALLYGSIFAHHQDRFFAAALAFISISILIVGAANAINIWSAFNFLGNGWPLVVCFWLLVFGFFSPAVLILLGRGVVKRGCHHAVDCARQCAALLKDMARKDAAATVLQMPKPENDAGLVP